MIIRVFLCSILFILFVTKDSVAFGKPNWSLTVNAQGKSKSYYALKADVEFVIPKADLPPGFACIFQAQKINGVDITAGKLVQYERSLSCTDYPKNVNVTTRVVCLDRPNYMVVGSLSYIGVKKIGERDTINFTPICMIE